MPISLDALNAAFDADFVEALDGVFEHAPFIAEAAAASRPFTTVTILHEAMMDVVRHLSRAEQIGFVKQHPSLAGRAARDGSMAPESISEQAGLGLNALSDVEFERFERLNSAYSARFGMPFVVCVRRLTRDSLLDVFESRLRNDEAAELDTALAEIAHITRLRLVERVNGPGMPKVYGRLSTHVLDTHLGQPAEGVAITLFEIGRTARAKLTQATTNADGRTDAPLITGQPLRVGTYELVFDIGNHFARRRVPMPHPPFLNEIPLRFCISQPEGDYHVPLIVTPWSYSTYRGS